LIRLILFFLYLIIFIFLIGDVALTQEAFIAVAGELGTGHTNVEWHFI